VACAMAPAPCVHNQPHSSPVHMPKHDCSPSPNARRYAAVAYIGKQYFNGGEAWNDNAGAPVLPQPPTHASPALSYSVCVRVCVHVCVHVCVVLSSGRYDGSPDLRDKVAVITGANTGIGKVPQDACCCWIRP
jgi:hypothetical protein